MSHVSPPQLCQYLVNPFIHPVLPMNKNYEIVKFVWRNLDPVAYVTAQSLSASVRTVLLLKEKGKFHAKPAPK